MKSTFRDGVVIAEQDSVEREVRDFGRADISETQEVIFFLDPFHTTGKHNCRCDMCRNPDNYVDITAPSQRRE